MKNKIEVINFIKGYSILSIVLFHYCQGIGVSPMFSRAINFGGTGIHTFLFASGFGLYLSYLQRPLPYRDFLKKRFTKIYIPYIFVVTVTALISLLIPLYENSWNNYFSHVFMYKMFSDQLIGSYGYQLWFISTIIQFYLLFFLIVSMWRWFPGRSFLALGLLISWGWAALVLLLHKEEFRNWNSFFLIYLWEFILGMYCAERYLNNGYAFWKISKTRLFAIAVAGLTIYSLMAIQFGRPGKIFNDLPGLFGYGALCLLIYSLHIKLFNRFILFTSTISYSIFLIHFLVLNLAQAAFRALDISWSWVMLIPCIILCYAVAIPLQKFFDRLTRGMLKRQQTQHLEYGEK